MNSFHTESVCQLADLKKFNLLKTYFTRNVYLYLRTKTAEARVRGKP